MRHIEFMSFGQQPVKLIGAVMSACNVLLGVGDSLMVKVEQEETRMIEAQE